MLRLVYPKLKHLISFSRTKSADQLIKQLYGSTQQNSSEINLAIDKIRMKRSKQMAQNNQKIRNYHNYQYSRGQDFIQNIPYNEHMKYTIKDQITEQQQKERKTIEHLKPIGNHYQRATLIRQKINAYHDKQKKYQKQQFEKYLSQYPGSVRGPRPEDDWQYFRNYALKKIPKTLLDQLSEQHQLSKEREEQRKNDDEEDQVIGEPPQMSAGNTILSNLTHDRIILKENSSKQEQTAFMNKIDQGMSESQILQDFKTEVPLVPTLNFQNYQHFMNYWIGWLNFRNTFLKHNYDRITKQIEEHSLKKLDKQLQYLESQWFQIPANIPSLYRYYKCLPKSIQDHPGMKDIYLGLQYSSPDYTYQQKQNALNKTCPMLLPLDDISTKVMQDYTECSRAQPSIYLHQKVLTISPEFTWDMGQFLEEVRKQELRGQTSNQNKDTYYPSPPQVHKMWQEGAANLPVDFYDNQDGFWDRIISQKLKRYDQHKPMLKTRKYFTH